MTASCAIPDVQSSADTRNIAINKVGIKAIRHPVIVADREGGVQHSSFDNSANAGAYIADWVAETLRGRTA